MKPGQCEICLNEFADSIANKVVKKDLTMEQAAKELGVSLPDWCTHYELHVRSKLVNAIATDIEPIKNELIDKIKEGTESVNRLIGITKKIHAKLEDENNQKNTKLLSIYATLEGNSIKALKELALLEGDITSAKEVHYHTNIIKIENITKIIMEEVSKPEDKARILKRLEEIEVAPVAN